jgi:hypothetical protein
MNHTLGSILLSSILTISGILVIILNMFHENIPAYVGLGGGLVVLGVIIHFWHDGHADAEP